MHICATTSDDLAFWIALPFYMAVGATPVVSVAVAQGSFWEARYIGGMLLWWTNLNSGK
jgi:hypothetical protein